MTEEKPNVTTESAAVERSATQPKPTRPPTFWVRYWWVPLSFVVPFVVIYCCLGTSAHLNIASCFRSGTIGLVLGAVIIALWSLDQRIRTETSPKPVRPMVGLLGIALWLGWVIAAHVMVLANDEAYYVADYENTSSIIAHPGVQLAAVHVR